MHKSIISGTEKSRILHYNYPDVADVDALAAKRNYKNRSEITVSHDKMEDAHEFRIKIHFDEHLHEDEEIRYVPDVRGYFDFRDTEDDWIRIRLNKHSLMIMAAGMHRRFKPASNNSTDARQSSLSFTQGFLLGQLSICLLLFFFIKFFIFGEAPYHPHVSSISPSPRRSSSSHLKDARHQRVGSSPLRPPPRLTTASILRKTYYNVASHTPESLDWFNVLVAQTIAQLRTDAHTDDAILTSLTAVLNGTKKPDFLDEIRVTEISLGEEFPIFSNCRVIPVDDDGDQTGTKAPPPPSTGGAKGWSSTERPSSSGRYGPPDATRLQARMDVDLADAITLGIETKIVLNYPRPKSAVIPVALAVSVVRFSGTLSISFIPSPSPQSSGSPVQPDSTEKDADPTPPTTLTFSLLPDYRLELSTRSLLGSRSRLQDVPKIAQVVEARLHAWVDERCVEPRFQQVILPSLWPRRRNTRGGDTDASTAVDGSSEVSSSPRLSRTARRPTGDGLSGDLRQRTKYERYSDTDGCGPEGVMKNASNYSMPGSMP
ncbi:MAG: ERMES complex subunit mmm1 [Chrysothrix sp. TS-e1954]|nr:MAG: ERMES complex subunit mmm1 [Chrysothrix sp. TS-e1954]